MDRQGDEVHLTAQEASGGSKPAIGRYVLGISLALVVIAFAVIWIIGASNAPQGTHQGPITNQPAPTGGGG
jgi:hypothetical protein